MHNCFAKRGKMMHNFFTKRGKIVYDNIISREVSVMKRQYEDQIQNWIDASSKALLIYGARNEAGIIFRCSSNRGRIRNLS